MGLSKGDIATLKHKKRIKFNRGNVLEVVSVADNGKVILNTMIELKESQLVKIGITEMKYEESNRFKLKQVIKNTGHTAKDLSLAIGANKFYFSTEYSETRFNSRGDMSNKRLDELLFFADAAVKNISNSKFGEINKIQDIGKTPYPLHIDVSIKEEAEPNLVDVILEKDQTTIEKQISKEKEHSAFFILIFVLIVSIAVGAIVYSIY